MSVLGSVAIVNNIKFILNCAQGMAFINCVSFISMMFCSFLCINLMLLLFSLFLSILLFLKKFYSF